jgi:hypothetical protein
MNSEQLQEFEASYGGPQNFKKRFVEAVPVDNIEIDAIEDQVRTKGEIPNHIQTLKEQIDAHGQIVPITGQRLPDGKYRCIAGVHRVKALKLLQEETEKKQTVLVASGFAEVDFKSKEEERLYQLNENTTFAKQDNDTEDYIETFSELIRDEGVLGNDMTQITPEKINEYIKAKVPKLTARTRTKITKKIYSSGLFAGQRKFKNYPTKKEAAKVFSKINQWGFQVEDSGDVSKGWKIIFVDNKNGISQHATMYAYNAKNVNNGQAVPKVMVVCYCGNVRTKTPNLNKYRGDAVKAFDNQNTHPDYSGDILDAIVFLPQVLLGEDKEDMNCTLSDTTHQERNEKIANTLIESKQVALPLPATNMEED